MIINKKYDVKLFTYEVDFVPLQQLLQVLTNRLSGGILFLSFSR